MMDMHELAQRLAKVQATIRDYEARHHRVPGSVALLAVSKRQPVSAIEGAHAAGQRAFGENYLQEALTKIEALATLPIEWHFIGPVQGNKTADVAANFSWVHTIDRIRIAERLNNQRPQHLPPLNVLIQVNVSGEGSKHGIKADALPALAAEVASLPRLALRGLMTLPAPNPDFGAQRAAFAILRELAAASPLAMDTLSMGTSDDFEAAIAEGSTMVRLGTVIFGPRG
jgi:pyridoxal phosphate enzyme (YggS family)